MCVDGSLGLAGALCLSLPLLGSLMPPPLPAGSDSYHQQPCPRGHYCPALSPAPLPCPPGTHGSSHFAKHPGDCQPCPAGTFNHLPAQPACFPCGSSSSSQPGEFLCVSGVFPSVEAFPGVPQALGSSWSWGCCPCPAALPLSHPGGESQLQSCVFPLLALLPKGIRLVELSSSTDSCSIVALEMVGFHQDHFSQDLGGLC